MSESSIGTDIVLEAMITRADGTVEDLGVISANKDDLPDWFKEIVKKAKEIGVIENG